MLNLVQEDAGLLEVAGAEHKAMHCCHHEENDLNCRVINHQSLHRSAMIGDRSILAIIRKLDLSIIVCAYCPVIGL